MKLLNKYLRGKEWLVNQYNRNRPFKDHISHKIEKCDLADEISFSILFALLSMTAFCIPPIIRGAATINNGTIFFYLVINILR